MERKLNAIHKSKSKSQPDLYKVGADGKVIYTGGKSQNIDDQLHELASLSGINMDVDVFNIVIDLLRLNVNPNTILDVFRKMAQQRGMKPSKSSDNISRTKKSTISDSKPSKNYAAFLDPAGK